MFLFSFDFLLNRKSCKIFSIDKAANLGAYFVGIICVFSWSNLLLQLIIISSVWWRLNILIWSRCHLIWSGQLLTKYRRNAFFLAWWNFKWVSWIIWCVSINFLLITLLTLWNVWIRGMNFRLHRLIIIISINKVGHYNC